VYIAAVAAVYDRRLYSLSRLKPASTAVTDRRYSRVQYWSDMKFDPGDSLGQYRIEVLLDAGGMGAVYRAHDTRLERPVAIKVLSASSNATSIIDDLLREARSASALNHPNVCTVYEVGEEGDCAFIAMEYVDGQALDTLLNRGRLRIAVAADYAYQIADTLSHAHEQGVVQGDLKTPNILISSKNRIKIADFGLARRHESSGRFSTVTTGVIAGTPYAMAPEQLRGGRPDMQTDVWSLGVVFFELLAGMPPFTGATLPEVASKILRDPVPTLPDSVAAALRQVVERCLIKDPPRRFRSAGEVRASLEAALKTIQPPRDGARLPYPRNGRCHCRRRLRPPNRHRFNSLVAMRTLVYSTQPSIERGPAAASSYSFRVKPASGKPGSFRNSRDSKPAKMPWSCCDVVTQRL
jgi:serine/threonine protein kinase